MIDRISYFLAEQIWPLAPGTFSFGQSEIKDCIQLGFSLEAVAHLTLELKLKLLLRLSCFNLLLALTGVKVGVVAARSRDGVIGFGVFGFKLGAEAWSRPRILGWVLGLLLGELLAPEGWGRFRLLGWALDLLLSAL